MAISGSATEDQTLTASNTLADLDGLGAISYHWQRDTGSGFVNISGASASTYQLGDADVGATVRVVASYTDAKGTSESVASGATAPIANVNDAPTGTVAISGSATEDQTLTASNTLADLDGLGAISYHWQRDTGSGFVNISGASASAYQLGDADVGATVRVVASYTDAKGTSESVASGATAPIANVNDAPTGTVTISGSATEDQTLTASNTLADLDGLGAISYHWQRDTGSGFVNISGASASTYQLGDADVGATVRVVASYTDAKGTSESVASGATAPIANVNDAPTGMVTISGSATEDQTLTASNTLADLDGLGAISYHWQRDTGSGFVNISGASASAYQLGDADVGATVRVVASYTDAKGTSESVASGATAPIANVNDAPTGTVAISGSATEDQTLTASNTLADLDGLGAISYHWQRDTGSGFVNISGASASTYQLGDADVGATVRVVASYTDGHGTAESVASGPTASIANVNDLPANLQLSANAAPENVPDAVIGILSATDVDPGEILTYAIQPGANAGLFTIVGNELRVGSSGLDYEASATRFVIVRAIDGAGGFTEQTFAIDVLDGEEWVLSSGQDTIPPSDANAQVIGTATTLNSNDILEGGDGRDSLVLFGAGTFNLNNITSFTNFEEVRLVNFVSTGTTLTLRDGTTTDVIAMGIGTNAVNVMGTAAIGIMQGGDGQENVTLANSATAGTIALGNGDYQGVDVFDNASVQSIVENGYNNHVYLYSNAHAGSITLNGSDYQYVQINDNASVDTLAFGNGDNNQVYLYSNAHLGSLAFGNGDANYAIINSTNAGITSLTLGDGDYGLASFDYAASWNSLVTVDGGGGGYDDLYLQGSGQTYDLTHPATLTGFEALSLYGSNNYGPGRRRLAGGFLHHIRRPRQHAAYRRHVARPFRQVCEQCYGGQRQCHRHDVRGR